MPLIARVVVRGDRQWIVASSLKQPHDSRGRGVPSERMTEIAIEPSGPVAGVIEFGDDSGHTVQIEMSSTEPDSVGLLTPRPARAGIRRYFPDGISATRKPNVASP